MTLATFKESALAVNPIHVNRTTDACDWVCGDVEVCHERAQFPWSPFSPASFHYWGNVIFTDKALAEREAKEFSGRVALCFYCDEANPAWFLIFDDLDCAIAHAFHHLKP